MLIDCFGVKLKGSRAVELGGLIVVRITSERLVSGLEPRRIAIWTAIVFGASMLWGLARGGVVRGFDEGHPGTILSIALLLATAATAFAIHAVRKKDGAGFPRLIWWLIGIGFVFLALDEALEIHEKLDAAIHAIFRIEETAATDRIDDLLILLYGVIGLSVLALFGTEVRRAQGLVQWLPLGFALLVIQVIIDAASNRDDFMLWLGVPPDWLSRLSTPLSLAEEAAKIGAEVAFLLGFLATLRSFQNRVDQEG